MNKYRKEVIELLNQRRVVGFDEIAQFRIKKDQRELVEKFVRLDSEKYDSVSHFYRCAVIKLIREEKERLRA